MNLRAICFTGDGAALCKTLVETCPKRGCFCQGYTIPRLGAEFGLTPISSLDSWVREAFAAKKAGACDGLVFVGASGIAVRAIAPHLQSKAQDPAVVTIDDQGAFVVSLVAGHIGGANALAELVSGILEATAVISTATDRNHCFAVDSWAVKNKFWLQDLAMIKVVSGSLLAGEQVGLASDFAITCKLPPGLVKDPSCQAGICLTYDANKQPFAKTLNLIPQRLHLGIGCRRGATEAQIQGAVDQVLAEYGISWQAICQVASIDLKADETGLLAFAQTQNLPCRFYTAQALQQVKGEFSQSAFVAGVTGVGNVCERGAVLSSGGKLLIKKQVVSSVTVALAEEPWEVSFGY